MRLIIEISVLLYGTIEFSIPIQFKSLKFSQRDAWGALGLVNCSLHCCITSSRPEPAPAWRSTCFEHQFLSFREQTRISDARSHPESHFIGQRSFVLRWEHLWPPSSRQLQRCFGDYSRHWWIAYFRQSSPKAPIFRDYPISIQQPWVVSCAPHFTVLPWDKRTKHGERTDETTGDGVCVIEVRFTSPWAQLELAKPRDIRAAAGHVIKNCVQQRGVGGLVIGLGETPLSRSVAKSHHWESDWPKLRKFKCLAGTSVAIRSRCRVHNDIGSTSGIRYMQRSTAPRDARIRWFSYFCSSRYIWCRRAPPTFVGRSSPGMPDSGVLRRGGCQIPMARNLVGRSCYDLDVCCSGQSGNSDYWSWVRPTYRHWKCNPDTRHSWRLNI